MEKILVYKVSKEYSKDYFLKLVGEFGNKLNPVEDAEGNLVITIEELESNEFQKYQSEFISKVENFELIEWSPPNYG